MSPSISAATTIVCLLAGTFGAESAGHPPLTPKPYFQLAEWLHRQQLDPTALLDPATRDACAADCQLEPQRLAALLERGTALSLAVEKWAQQGIWVLSRYDGAYPRILRQRLRHQAPPLLYGAGDPVLLRQPGIAVVGSRDASEEALAFAAAIGEAAAQQGFTIISGSARGVDRGAMGSTIDADGQTIGVLGDSLGKQAVGREIRDWLRRGNLTLVSPYQPETGHNVGNLMARNKLIYALAQAAIVVQTAAGSGGTWTGASEALAAGWVPVWYWADPEAVPANAKLERLGGQPLVRAALEDLAALGRTPTTPAPESVPASVTQRAHMDLFELVWPLLQELLREPCTEKELRERLPEIKPASLTTWLKRAESSGSLQKLKKPVRWALTASEPAPVDSGQLTLLPTPD